MGSSAHAHLVFGIHFSEEVMEDWRSNLTIDFNEFDYQEIYAHLKGVKSPNVAYKSSDANVQELYKKFWREQRIAWKVAGVDYICWGDYVDDNGALFYINSIEVYQGEVRDISIQDLTYNDFDVQKLKEFCEVMRLPYSEPKWILTASYF